MFSKLLFSILLAVGVQVTAHADTIDKELPAHEILTVLPSQPIQGAKLVYWDQAVADALGIQLPPGRVGNYEFEQAILKMMAFEIHESPTPLSPQEVNTLHDSSGLPYFFIENDAMGGSGRAGFIQISPGIFVNIKGIGTTGLHGHTLGPPAKNFESHADGSATLEEAIKETIYGRMADAETTAGGSRVIAIISTPRMIKYDDGNEVPLAIIVRVPTQRYDQAKRLKIQNSDGVLESLAQANAMRILKGDFVNSSNMGGDGEFVDYGCITHIGDYNPAKSTQPSRFLNEADYLFKGIFKEAPDYTDKLGKYLLMQMGIPESVAKTNRSVEKMGRSFATLVRQKKGVLLDFQSVSEEQIEDGFNLHGWMADLIANYYENPMRSKEEFKNLEWARAITGQYLKLSSEERYAKYGKHFLYSLYDSLMQLPAPKSSNRLQAYAEKIRLISRFKNRDIQDLVRPTLFQKAGALARDFANTRDAGKIQYVIDEIVLSNRLGTSAGAESNLLIRATELNTEISVRAYQAADGSVKLFQYPELKGALPGEKFRFRLTTDNWSSFTDYDSEFVQTTHGQYLLLKIPHGTMAVTDQRLEMSPFIEDNAQHITWLSHNFHLKGPPLLFNERLGLASSMSRKDGYYHVQPALGEDVHPLQTTVGEFNCKKSLWGK